MLSSSGSAMVTVCAVSRVTAPTSRRISVTWAPRRLRVAATATTLASENISEASECFTSHKSAVTWAGLLALDHRCQITLIPPISLLQPAPVTCRDIQVTFLERHITSSYPGGTCDQETIRKTSTCYLLTTEPMWLDILAMCVAQSRHTRTISHFPSKATRN